MTGPGTGVSPGVVGIVDSHHHLWDPAERPHDWLVALPSLNRPFNLSQLEQVATPLGVSATVLVQVLNDGAETEEFLALASASELIAGVIGWVDLTDPGVAESLARLTELPGGDKLVGVRHLVQSEPDPAWLQRPEVRRGVRAVSESGGAFDLLVSTRELPAAVDLAEHLEDATLVIDHMAKPEIGASIWEPWNGLIGRLARNESVVCKISGLVSQAGRHWDPAAISPYVERVVELFGPNRLLFGSDWPVCTAMASYDQVLGLARDLVTPLVGEEIDAVFGGTARRIYKLAPGGFATSRTTRTGRSGS
ncbi:MAG: amidohydrolase family protein [Acidimicrobiales bacterium]